MAIDEIKNKITDDIDHWLNEYKKDDFDKILINPLPDFSQNDLVSIDLHIGNEINYPTEIMKKKIDEDGLFLESGETVNLITQDYIGLPRNIAGFVMPKLSCTIQGLSHISTRVDPGFHGKLVETISNLDKTKIKIIPGNSFCSLIFFEVKGVKRMYKGDYIGQESLNNVLKKLDELYKKKYVNPSMNPIMNKKQVLSITTKAISTICFATLITLYGLFQGVTLNNVGLIIGSIFALGIITYHLVK